MSHYPLSLSLSLPSIFDKFMNPLPTWRQMNMDTTVEAEAVLFRLLAEMPPWRKWQLIDQHLQLGREMLRGRLQARYPAATAVQIHRLMADELLGRELAETVYGPYSPELVVLVTQA